MKFTVKYLAGRLGSRVSRELRVESKSMREIARSIARTNKRKMLYVIVINPKSSQFGKVFRIAGHQIEKEI